MTDQHSNLASRLWRKDVSLWQPSADEARVIADRLGWLHAIDWMRARVGELRGWAEEVAQSGNYERAILLGMGGSSLAPAVFASLFKPAAGYLPLQVVDTTHPDEVARIAAGDLRRCLFIVASKSGSTVETMDLYHFFHAQLAMQCADSNAETQTQANFILITDEGSDLHRLGQDYSCQNRPCQKIFINPSDIGGRYAALSYFGLVPAALLGLDVDQLLDRAQTFAATTKSDHPSENPALALGMFLGRNALAGKDKLILRLPRQLRVFGLWLEQLIAESTGKHGTGLVPVLVDEQRQNNPHHRFDDRITIGYGGINSGGAAEAQPMDWEMAWDDPYQLGAEFFRWEIATAIAASYLAVNPFDQPDVAQSKDRTRALLCGREPIQPPTCHNEKYDLHYHAATAATAATHISAHVIAEFCRTLKPENYLGVLAYLPEEQRTWALLQALGEHAARRWGIVSTIGIGPRYLHSTGQLHKGGPATGRFIQFIADFDTDRPVPRRQYTFGQLYRAQADGDFSALAQTLGHGAVMRVRLKADRLQSLAAFVDEFIGASTDTDTDTDPK